MISLLRTRVLPLLLISCLWFLSWSPAAYALTQIDLKDLVAEECPADAAYAENLTTSGSSMSATCYLVKGTAVNNSARDIVDADIFGRIFDAEGNAVMKNRYRLGGIEYVPMGESAFSFRISVPSVQPAPLRLEKFKASGFASKVRRFQEWNQSIDE
ncbi:hypothetical protein S7335_1701 [Synechococcus sp. PCC 7335]|uniref:hypothetical protein n=1 Tax=Synechococcus sp. (strain ATCC 29403 / PCC 7335) TaxID=91464 RepID=UPI00017ED248|nr:hypothetical protein [Synechococcus sp. PCC 7335]EDX84004.1 hypothetical protein S7335_1701 [Synechococcus sp. PCC 7335]